MDTVIMIPAYKPNHLMLETVGQLRHEGFDILIIDDGSGEEYKDIFQKVSGDAEVLSYPKNHGKGYALRYGMERLSEIYPDCRYFITADADGQHSLHDIINICSELHTGRSFILGTRTLTKDAPLRSRFGNSLSRFIFTIASGCYLSDNQTGLRGFSTEHIEWMLRIGGNRYEYEMNMLIFAVKQRIRIDTIPIETIYIDDNSSSHFNPVLDTLRIHKRIFVSSMASIIAFLVSLYLILIASFLTGWEHWAYIVYSTSVSSAMLSWVLNRFVWYHGFNFRCERRLFFLAIIRFILYMLVMFLLHSLLPVVPLFICYVVTVGLVVVAEYFLLKAIASM
ncbi:MAG: glycosyltransferase family 2 protein [Clostridia bacterium]|nr:glycosyltransferase family 2 protein [Clostridia bacterium]